MNTKFHTFWPRFFAIILDGLIFLLLGFAVNVIVDNYVAAPFLTAWFFIRGFSQPIYRILMHGRYGQTVGKMAMGIIIIHASEDSVINYKKAIIREFPNWIAATLYFIMKVNLQFFPSAFPNHAVNVVYLVFGGANLIWFLLEVITMFTNDKRRALHDYLAHTVVVRKEFLIPEVPLLEIEEKAA